MKAIDYLKEFLSEEGFRSQQHDGHVTFKYEGTTFIMSQEDNERVFAVFVICRDIEDDDRLQILELCNKFNHEKNLVKVLVMGTLLVCTYETYIDDEFTTKSLPSMLGYLDSVADEVLSEFNEQEQTE